MKKIFNWTFGSVFRTFGRILAYLSIGILFALFLNKNDIKIYDLIGIDKVNAATTITPSSYQHKLIYRNAVQGVVTTHDSGWFTNSYTNFCSDGVCGIVYDYYVTNYSSSLDSGRAYTLNFATWLTDRPTQTQLNQLNYYILASNTGGYTGSSPSFITSLSCRAGIEEGTTSKVSFSCSFIPSQPINYIYLRIGFDSISGSSGGSFGFNPFTSFGCNIGSIVYDTAQTDAINQQTNVIQDSTTNIINNNNNNTQQIIDNNNQNTQAIIDSNMSCQIIDKDYISLFDNVLGTSGSPTPLVGNYGITDYIKIDSNSKISLVQTTGNGLYFCFYDINKTFISCTNSRLLSLNEDIPVPSTANFVKFTISKATNKPQFKICKNGNQALIDSLEDDNINDNKVKEILDDLPVDDETALGPLTGFLTLPLTWIQNLLASNQTCTTLHLPLPFVNSTLDLPCMTEFWNSMGVLKLLIETVWVAIVCSRVFNLFFKLTLEAKNTDPNSYENLTKLKEWEL